MPFRKGDFGNKITVVVTDAETNAVVPLTGRDVYIIIRLNGVVTEYEMTVTDEVNGIAEYALEDGDVDSYGEMEIEFRVEEYSGETQVLNLTSERETEEVENILPVPTPP